MGLKQLKEKSVMFTYCTGGNVKERTMVSLIRTLEFDKANFKLIGDIGSQTGLYVADNRDLTVENFLAHPLNFKWFMSIDTDVVWEPPQFYDLLYAAETDGYPVLGGMYFTFLDGGKIHPVWKQKTSDGIFAACTGVFEKGVQQIDGLGMGFTLIRRDVLEKMGKVYKDDRWRWFGHDYTVFRGKPAAWGEDLSFCERARAIGFNTYGHAGVRVGHLKEILLDDKLFMALAARGQTGSMGTVGQVVEANGDHPQT
jgi:hypothetical protein